MNSGKLVRDNIPEIIKARGGNPIVRVVASESEFLIRLQEKLKEETAEFLASNDPEELADILEVVKAFAKTHNLTLEDIETIRAQKARERGGFEKRIVLEKS